MTKTNENPERIEIGTGKPDSLHEVLACPFCGGAAQVRPREDYYDYRVFCCDDKCGCSSPKAGHTWEQAVEWWNRRQANPTRTEL